jgi:hypothetical protein
MVTMTLHCPYCQSDALVRNGRAPHGKQKYLCRACQRQSREDPTPHAYAEERPRGRSCVPIRSVAAYAGLSGRIAGLTHHDSELDQKKAAQLPRLSQTLIPPDPNDPASSILELDELWSNAREKDEPDLGLDCALPLHTPSHRLCDRRPKPRDLSSPVGSHSSSIPSESLLYGLLGSPTCQCYQRNSIRRKAPETGETAHMERWNNTALATPCSLRPQNTLFFKIGHPA